MKTAALIAPLQGRAYAAQARAIAIGGISRGFLLPPLRAVMDAPLASRQFHFGCGRGSCKAQNPKAARTPTATLMRRYSPRQLGRSRLIVVSSPGEGLVTKGGGSRKGGSTSPSRRVALATMSLAFEPAGALLCVRLVCSWGEFVRTASSYEPSAVSSAPDSCEQLCGVSTVGAETPAAPSSIVIRKKSLCVAASLRMSLASEGLFGEAGVGDGVGRQARAESSFQPPQGFA